MTLKKILDPASFAAPFRCPFCNGNMGISAEYDSLCHETPACATFEELDADQFIDAVGVAWDAADRDADDPAGRPS